MALALGLRRGSKEVQVWKVLSARTTSFGYGRHEGYGTSMAEVVANADTTKMSHEEIRKFGLAQQPPGTRVEGGGKFMHQQKGFSGHFLKKELYPVYPLFGMVGLAVGLAIVTAGRELFMAPQTYVTKVRREECQSLSVPRKNRSLQSTTSRRAFSASWHLREGR